MNVIIGVPRSGSTLFCNILAQNTAFAVTDTTPLCAAFTAACSAVAGEENTKAVLINKEEERIRESLTSLVTAYHPKDKLGFDKHRGWAASIGALQSLLPKSVAICLVRNPVDVLSSIERGHRETEWISHSAPMSARIVAQIQEGGFLHTAIAAVEDIVRRKQKGVIMIRYEDFVIEPEITLRRVYKLLGVGYYDHNFLKVENTSQEVDGLHLNKYRHQGVGEVIPREDHHDYFDESIIAQIKNQFPFFCSTFHYQ